jgi:hypothetical protein
MGPLFVLGQARRGASDIAVGRSLETVPLTRGLPLTGGAAAPYVHPRLAATTMQAAVRLEDDLSYMSDDELLRHVERLMAETKDKLEPEDRGHSLQ